MNKKQQIQMIKPAVLLSVAMDLDISDEINEAAGDIVDELYQLPGVKNNTLIHDIASKFENNVTNDKTAVAQLLLETIKDTRLAGTKFNKLFFMLGKVTEWGVRKQDLHNKTESLIRNNYNEYKEKV